MGAQKKLAPLGGSVSSAWKTVTKRRADNGDPEGRADTSGARPMMLRRLAVAGLKAKMHDRDG